MINNIVVYNQGEQWKIRKSVCFHSVSSHLWREVKKAWVPCRLYLSAHFLFYTKHEKQPISLQLLSPLFLSCLFLFYQTQCKRNGKKYLWLYRVRIIPWMCYTWHHKCDKNLGICLCSFVDNYSDINPDLCLCSFVLGEN